MDVLGIEQANVVGHSMGGWILTLLSYESPDRVRRAVNVCGGGGATRPPQKMVGFNGPWPRHIRAHYARMATASNGAFTTDELAATFIRKRDLPGHPEAF